MQNKVTASSPPQFWALGMSTKQWQFGFDPVKGENVLEELPPFPLPLLRLEGLEDLGVVLVFVCAGNAGFGNAE